MILRELNRYLRHYFIDNPHFFMVRISGVSTTDSHYYLQMIPTRRGLLPDVIKLRAEGPVQWLVIGEKG
jgi:hypothetical protein